MPNALALHLTDVSVLCNSEAIFDISTPSLYPFISINISFSVHFLLLGIYNHPSSGL